MQRDGTPQRQRWPVRAILQRVAPVGVLLCMAGQDAQARGLPKAQHDEAFKTVILHLNAETDEVSARIVHDGAAGLEQSDGAQMNADVANTTVVRLRVDTETGQVDPLDAGLPWWWLAFGFIAQLMFTARMLIQWIASERAKRSTVPVAFWILSLLGGLTLLLYFLRRGDPVGVLGQAFGVVIYVRNLVLIRRRKGTKAGVEDGAAPARPAHESSSSETRSGAALQAS